MSVLMLRCDIHNITMLCDSKQLLQETKNYKEEEIKKQINNLFHIIDSNSDGFISIDELSTIFSYNENDMLIGKLINKVMKEHE